jgi:hypothetical protein
VVFGVRTVRPAFPASNLADQERLIRAPILPPGSHSGLDRRAIPRRS